MLKARFDEATLGQDAAKGRASVTFELLSEPILFAPGCYGYKVELSESKVSDVLLKQIENELLRLTCGGQPLLQSDGLTQAGILLQNASGQGQHSGQTGNAELYFVAKRELGIGERTMRIGGAALVVREMYVPDVECGLWVFMEGLEGKADQTAPFLPISSNLDKPKC